MQKATSAAVVEHMLEDHRQLQGAIQEIQEYLKLARPEADHDDAHGWAAGLSIKLVDLHSKLTLHFRKEEKTGILDELAAAYPRASRRMKQLQGEHGLMLNELNELVGATMRYGQGTPSPNPHLRTWVRALIEQLEQHEHDETELMQKLHCDEIGTGD